MRPEARIDLADFSEEERKEYQVVGDIAWVRFVFPCILSDLTSRKSWNQSAMGNPFKFTVHHTSMPAASLRTRRKCKMNLHQTLQVSISNVINGLMPFATTIIFQKYLFMFLSARMPAAPTPTECALPMRHGFPSQQLDLPSSSWMKEPVGCLASILTLGL